MAEVVTFLDYTPPARFDLLPWTQVQVLEAPAELGPFTLLDTIALSPVDTDPSDPAARSFTTELGTAIDYWYEVVFVDGSGDVSQPSVPVQNTVGDTAVPYATAAELAAILQVNATTQAAPLERVLLAAAGEINSEIGADVVLVSSWQLALAAEVNLERAVEHWQQGKSPFGIIGLTTESPTHTATNSWERHAAKLAPLKASWGVA